MPGPAARRRASSSCAGDGLPARHRHRRLVRVRPQLATLGAAGEIGDEVGQRHALLGESRRSAGAATRRPPPGRDRRRTSMTGTFCSWASRTLACIRSERSSTSARRPAAASASRTVAAYSRWRSAIGMTITCTGASHSGKAPAKCSVMTADEALERAVDGVVDDRRALEAAIGRAVLQVEALRQLVVELDGRVLPLAAQGVLDEDVDLGGVERARRPDPWRTACPTAPAPSSACPRPCPRTRRSPAASPAASPA